MSELHTDTCMVFVLLKHKWLAKFLPCKLKLLCYQYHLSCIIWSCQHMKGTGDTSVSTVTLYYRCRVVVFKDSQCSQQNLLSTSGTAILVCKIAICAWEKRSSRKRVLVTAKATSVEREVTWQVNRSNHIPRQGPDRIARQSSLIFSFFFFSVLSWWLTVSQHVKTVPFCSRRLWISHTVSLYTCNALELGTYLMRAEIHLRDWMPQLTNNLRSCMYARVAATSRVFGFVFKSEVAIFSASS